MPLPITITSASALPAHGPLHKLIFYECPLYIFHYQTPSPSSLWNLICKGLIFFNKNTKKRTNNKNQHCKKILSSFDFFFIEATLLSSCNQEHSKKELLITKTYTYSQDYKYSIQSLSEYYSELHITIHLI